MKTAGIANALEVIAPLRLAEEWDNVGLLVGNATAEVRKVLVCVDVTAQVLAEASRTRAQMVVSHHPVIFKPIPRVTAREAPLVYEATRKGIALYSMHTNFDAAPGGTNDVLAEAMGLKRVRPLRAAVQSGNAKIVVFVPPDDVTDVSNAAFAAGAGHVGNYSDCAFFSYGIGAFRGREGTRPAIGRSGAHEVTEELRLEVVAPKAKVAQVLAAIRAAHSYETPVVDVYSLDDRPAGSGAGRVGELSRPVTVQTLTARAKRALGVRRVLAAGRPGQRGGVKRANLVSVAACCAGAGASLLADALAADATFYLTGELGHHDALRAAEAGMTVVLLGHGNSERIAMRRLAEHLGETLPKLKVAYAASDRDPLEPA
jgi:dinuclear metal center YbgI/SA1388 family protein